MLQVECTVCKILLKRITGSCWVVLAEVEVVFAAVEVVFAVRLFSF
jgi:hypothetical protein